MDIKQILSLPEKERDDEIRKLIWPKAWKTAVEFEGCNPEEFMRKHYQLDWNLAMKMRDEAVESIGKRDFETLLWEIYCTESEPIGWVRWLSTSIQPHHYLLAALIAKEPK